jgi:NADH-quinone oxidoreductase subunit E
MSELSDEVKQKIKDLFDRYPTKQAITLPALHMVHDAQRCVSNKAIEEIATILELSPAQVHDTLSFYGYFRTQENPIGKKRVWVCRSLPCMLRGGEELLKELCDRWHLAPGETSQDSTVTIEYAECLGACDGAPCILIDDELSLNMDADKVEAELAEVLK